MKKRLLAYLFASGIALSAGAADYYVDDSAAGGGDGSFGAPFRTIQQASDIMTAGDTCRIRAGTYRETLNLTASGAGGSEITYAAYSNEVVVVSGLDQLAAVWTQGSNQIWSTTVGDEFHQLLTNNWAMVFIGDTPCLEARWPNMKYNENWISTKKWAKLTKSSTQYGKLVCSAIGSSGIDFNGAVLQMKWLANTFASRVITNHTAGSNAVYYPKKDSFGDPANIPVGGGGYDQRFYIDGKLDLLDAEYEWFYDKASRKLYIKTPGDADPAGLDICVKARQYGIAADDVAFNRFENIRLLATTFRFGQEGTNHCKNIVLSGCSVLYPDENRFIDTAVNPNSGKTAADLTSIVLSQFCVENGLIENCEFGWSQHRALEIWGRGTTVSNCVIHDSSLNGQMNNSGVRMYYGDDGLFTTEEANTLTDCTDYNCGGLGIYHFGMGPTRVLRNHVFNAGLYAGDISVTYLPTGPYATGTELGYNWIHWAPTALGMRCDSQGNGVTIHHNVVWDCGTGCKWQGWGPFNVVNNTYFSDSLFFDGNDGTNGTDIAINSDVMNNIYVNRMYFRGPPTLTYASYPDQNNDHFKDNVKVDKAYTGNIFLRANMFVSTDSATLDLRPKSGSVLIDNGAVVAGITTNFAGAAPDIGAYEYGGEYWVPGAHWLNDGWPVPTTMAAATALAAEILATVGPPQAPGIAVSGSGDFGTVAIGSYAEQTFIVTNTAHLNLLLTGSPPVQLIGDTDFAISSTVSSTNIAGGGSTTFTVRFSPTDAGASTGLVLIPNNTTNNNPYEFSVTGNGSNSWGLPVEYLIVGGGGAGGSTDGGGGGAGGLAENFGSPQPMAAASYAVAVGNGGLATNASGGNGGDSSVFDLIAAGGGGGGKRSSPGIAGGCGGGGGGNSGTNQPAGYGRIDQGNIGGIGHSGGTTLEAGGGGGGAASAGAKGSSGHGGNGGAGGDFSAYLGADVGNNGVFAGGGGGGTADGGTPGTGGSGGGGDAGVPGPTGVPAAVGTAGLANTGGGGGAGSRNSTGGTSYGCDGGSGVVIIRYPKDDRYEQATGGTEYDFVDGTNTYRVHVFTTNGTFIVNQAVTANGTPFAWLEQYYPGTTNLVDTDVSDTDGDGMSAWQEYAADTDPTNAASVLKITGVQPETGGMRIDWQGGEQARQYLEYTTNLLSPNGWIAIYTNEPPTSPTNSVTDANAVGSALYYRIRVERP